MNTGTYGLTTAIRGLGSGGPSLMQVGSDQQRQATGLMQNAASAEVARNLENKQREAQGSAGVAQIGSMVGAVAGGIVGGPVGAMAGGMIGGMAGNLF